MTVVLCTCVYWSLAKCFELRKRHRQAKVGKRWRDRYFGRERERESLIIFSGTRATMVLNLQSHDVYYFSVKSRTR
jgi:hypothetical protein